MKLPDAKKRRKGMVLSGRQLALVTSYATAGCRQGLGAAFSFSKKVRFYQVACMPQLQAGNSGDAGDAGDRVRFLEKSRVLSGWVVRRAGRATRLPVAGAEKFEKSQVLSGSP
jgi:hypothetical protein